MIETEQAIVIDAPIGAVWSFAEDIRAWANLMPGLQDCDILGDDDSRWTLKVGVGALVRTVNVTVHVDRWAGPNEVDFTYALKGDPVEGGGTYRARSIGANQTEIALGVKVIGTGPMAPMWEAMGRPLLPKFARAFAEQFKFKIEQMTVPVGSLGSVGATDTIGTKSVFGRLIAWLIRLLSKK